MLQKNMKLIIQEKKSEEKTKFCFVHAFKNPYFSTLDILKKIFNWGSFKNPSGIQRLYYLLPKTNCAKNIDKQQIY